METKICKECGRELPVEMFKLSRWGERVGVCTECAVKKARANKVKKQYDAEIKQARENARKSERQRTLEQFTPRELMSRLAELGYEGKLTFVQEIDITNF